MGTEECNNVPSIDTFDYVIVGSGPSATGILFGILEGISNAAIAGNHSTTNDQPSSLFSIAIIERGSGPPHDVATHYPHRWYEAAISNGNSSKSVKLYPSKIMGRVMDIPVGQGLGGTSNINACLCVPPLQNDLKSWPEPYRSSICSSAKYIKNIMEDNKFIHYTTSVENICNPFPPKNTKVEFYNKVPTLVVRDKKTGLLVRSNYHNSLLEPLLKKYPYLKKYIYWFRGYEAQRVLLKKKSHKVIGVECMSTINSNDCRNKSEYRKIYATRRTILCAGAIETPALLLVSKIGEKEPLSGIGEHLKDQAFLARVCFKSPSFEEKNTQSQSTNGIVALGHLHNVQSGQNVIDSIFQVAIADSAADAYVIPPVVAGALRWKFQNIILMEFVETTFRCVVGILYWAIIYTPFSLIIRHLTTTTMLFLMHPKSDGNVTIIPKKEPEKGEPIRRHDVTIQIDPKYLDDPRDMMALKSAWDVCHELTSSSSFELFPNLIFSFLKPFGTNNFWFESYCSCFLIPYYHFSGTCAMKSEAHEENSHWVVDSRTLKPRGYDGLYICDASVFPAMISNPPALTCASLGLEFARMILVEEHNRIASFYGVPK